MRVGDDALPISEPCKDSASKDWCLWTSMEAGMRSPGLYWVGAVVSLEWWVSERPRDKESEAVVVRAEGIVWICGVDLGC